MTKPLIILSCGGTGGHVTPARALAQDLAARGYPVEVLTDRRGIRYQFLFSDIPMHVVSAGTAGPGLGGKIRGALALLVGIGQALVFLRRRRPAIVVGFGGYPSVPGVLAAQMLRVPTVIHEQNAVIGWANAILARKATRIALSLPETQGLDEQEKQRTVVTGNPVRQDIAALYAQPYPVPEDEGKLHILVLGGSLGASVFSTVLPQALAMLPPAQRARLSIAQQARAEDAAGTEKLYAESGIHATLKSFFDDVPQQLAAAHLVIARAGASTVAEIATAGRPAIFVPYPHHKDQQQKMNADAVADAGGAWVMTESGFTPDALLARIETFLQNPSILARAAEKSRSCARPDAARKLGDVVVGIVMGV